MLHFLQSITHPLAVLLLATWVFFLFSLVWGGAVPAYAGVRNRTYDALIPFIAFLVVTVVAFIAWAFQVFSS